MAGDDEPNAGTCASCERVVIAASGGGLANRLRCLASAAALAAASGRRLALCWPSGGPFIPLGCALADVFAAPSTIAAAAEDDVAALKARAAAGDAAVAHVPSPRFVDPAAFDAHSPGAEAELPAELEACGEGTPRVVVLDSFRSAKPASWTPRRFAEFKRAFYATLVPSERVEHALRAARAALPGGAGTDGWVGVHWRRLDKAHALAAVTPEMYFEAMERADDPEHATRFFLASDDPTGVEKFAERFPGRVHTRATATRDEHCTLGGLVEAAVDLWLLAGCRLVVGTHTSTFSYEAAALGGVECVDVGAGLVTPEARWRAQLAGELAELAGADDSRIAAVGAWLSSEPCGAAGREWAYAEWKGCLSSALAALEASRDALTAAGVTDEAELQAFVLERALEAHQDAVLARLEAAQSGTGELAGSE